jgi:serine/threonine-protein kinase RsbW
MGESVVTLTFPAKADYLLLSRLALAGLARAHPLEPELLADLKLAVTEACGNAVKHAYGEELGPVTVTFHVADGRLEMTVEDRGAGLRVTATRDGTFPDQLESGMGMTIMHAVVDDLEIGAGAGGAGTLVRMTKHLVPTDPPGA